MKRISIYITLILALSLGLAPNAFAAGPDYSDQNLPLLKGLKLDVALDNATQITFKLRLTAETKKNVLSRIDYLQFLPAPNPLEPPCGFTGVKALKISWVLEGNQIKGAGVQEYVLERSFQMQKVCAGRYALSDINMQEPSIRLTDSANHWVEYSTSDYAPRQYKSSNVWKSPSAIQPKCEHNVSSAEYVRYLLCDENIDLINMIQGNVINITKEQISFVEAKAAAELKAKQEADAKAAAELKTKQEADAKAAAELKAKQEVEAAAKAAAELKAKQEAEAKTAAELKAKQDATADKAALAKAQTELASANAALADAQKVNRELQTQLNSVEAQFKLLSESVSAIQGQVSQLNSKLAAALAGQNAANAKLKKVCSAKPRPKGC